MIKSEIERGVFNKCHGGAAAAKLLGAMGKSSNGLESMYELNVYPPKTKKDLEWCLYYECESMFWQYQNAIHSTNNNRIFNKAPDFIIERPYYSITNPLNKDFFKTDRLTLSDSFIKDNNISKENRTKPENIDLNYAYSTLIARFPLCGIKDLNSSLDYEDQIRLAWEYLLINEFSNYNKREVLLKELIEWRDTLYKEYIDWISSFSDEEILEMGREQMNKAVMYMYGPFENENLNARTEKFLHRDDKRLSAILLKYVPASAISQHKDMIRTDDIVKIAKIEY